MNNYAILALIILGVGLLGGVCIFIEWLHERKQRKQKPNHTARPIYLDRRDGAVKAAEGWDDR